MKKLLLFITLLIASPYYLDAAAPAEDKIVTFLCGDDIKVEAPRELMARGSVTIANILEDIPAGMEQEPLPLPNISSSIMKTIINCLKYPSTPLNSLATMNPQTTFALILALQYLDIPTVTRRVYSEVPYIKWLLARSTSPLFVKHQCISMKKNKFTHYTSNGFTYVIFADSQRTLSLANPHEIVDPAAGHKGIKYSNNGKLIAATCTDNMVRIWDAHNGRCIYTLPHAKAVYKIHFSDDDKFLTTSDYVNSTHVWDMHTGKYLYTLEYTSLINSIKFSSDNTCIIASGSDLAIYVWDTETGELIRRIENPTRIISFDLSKNNTFVASLCYNGNIYMWNIHTGKNIQVVRPEPAVCKIKFDTKKECSLKIYGKRKDLTRPVYVWNFLDPEQILSFHYNHIVLISKIHERAMLNEKLDLSASGQEAKDLLTLFRLLPNNLKTILKPYVKLPLLSRIKHSINPTY